ncbi:hypothetical protein F2Q69_00006364 [Brassica cretica]|uniref:Uncharacterized protein n=1 Tax=Brassica cretica TaxID=69181 RepID=A0A8S9PFG5_BRACR|nr:hypothetical protein F2Q69_00006364 [Brassica cretica]
MVLDINQGSMSVAEYEEFFLAHEIVRQKNEQYLIQLAHYGLKEGIREGLESTKFATLGALFQEVAEVEEILDKEKTAENHRRQRKRKSWMIDPEDEYPWDQPEELLLVSESEDDWLYEGDTQGEVDEDDMSDNALVSGELMIYEDTDEEGEHVAVEQTRYGSGPSEAGAGSTA